MRIIFTSRKTEERDQEEQARYRQQEDNQRHEQERREDLAQEKELWVSVVQSRMENGLGIESSIKEADRILDAYHERFQ